MIEQENRLTLQDTEQLCELFMDCRLSVLQENELRYVLSRIDYHSPLIDDVRSLMGIELSVFDKSDPESPRIGKRWWAKKYSYLSIAASIAIILCLGIGLFHNKTSGNITSTPEYIAYVDGHRISKDAAKAQVEADILLADNFLNEMSEQEEYEKAMVDNFFNN